MRLEGFIKFRDLRRAKARIMFSKGELCHHFIIKIAVKIGTTGIYTFKGGTLRWQRSRKT